MTAGRSRISAWIASLAALALVVAVGGLVMLRVARTQAVDEMSEVAVKRFEGADTVVALVALAAAPDEPIELRDRAVWVLGEMRDHRALPALERLHVQEECDHDRLVCQREVRKAMAKIRGELSLRGALRSGWRAVRDRLGRLTGGTRGGPVPDGSPLLVWSGE